MALHDFYPRPRPWPRPRPLPFPDPIPEPAPTPYLPSPDRQEFEYIKDGIVYNGQTGKPIFNLKTNTYYY